VKDLERVARENREKADAARREREEASRQENERRRAEQERLDRERRERIEADNRQRLERLAAAKREREETLAKSREGRDALTRTAAASPVTPPSSDEGANIAAESDAAKAARAKVVAAIAAAPAAAVIATRRQPTVAKPAPTTAAATSSTASRDLVSRAFRAARLDTKVYQEVEADRNGAVQAAIVILIGALAAAVGSPRPAGNTPESVLADVIAGFVGWAAYALVAYGLGRRKVGESASRSFGQFARVLGFASAPRVLMLLGPTFAGYAWLWILVTTIIAGRSGLLLSTKRAVVVGITAWLAFLLGEAIVRSVARG
jgi:hypothetical protein